MSNGLKQLGVEQMKRKKPIALVLLFILMLAGAGCEQAKPVDSETEPNYIVKCVTRTAEDGWVYFFTYERNKEGAEEKFSNYLYDAYNLKYKHLEGYDIPLVNKQTGEIMQYIQTDLPYLSANQQVNQDIAAISDFFQKHMFQAPISASDLEGLTLHHIEKSDVLSLFNQTIVSEDLPYGKYGKIPEATIIKEDSLLSGYMWQVGYFSSYGNIVVLDIELLYENDIYLSDLIKDGKATEEQKKIQAKIEQVKAKILENQSFLAAEQENKEAIGSVQFHRLQALLKKLENKNSAS